MPPPKGATNYSLTASNLTIGSPSFGLPSLSFTAPFAMIALALVLGSPAMGSPTLAATQDYAVAAQAMTVGVPQMTAPALAADAVAPEDGPRCTKNNEINIAAQPYRRAAHPNDRKR